uniref:Uncharacterized protein n=1 Tax=Timema monikensis TaxID=170555 RepID=A0A7R9HLQ2_9NEOP|nr:unnamed protein product [Timema monikensis]
MEGILEGSVPPGSYTLLQCRTVRIGSYKVVPKEPVIISSLGVRIAVPCTDDENESVPITVDLGEVVKALIYFGRGRGIPVIFLYTLPAVGARVRATLNMDDDTRPYFDPSSADETQRWITLLPESLQEDSKVALKTIFGPLDNVLSELDKEKANDILVRTSPKVRRKVGNRCTDLLTGLVVTIIRSTPLNRPCPSIYHPGADGIQPSEAGQAGLEPWAPASRLETSLTWQLPADTFLLPCTILAS